MERPCHHLTVFLISLVQLRSTPLNAIERLGLGLGLGLDLGLGSGLGLGLCVQWRTIAFNGVSQRSMAYHSVRWRTTELN